MCMFLYVIEKYVYSREIQQGFTVQFKLGRVKRRRRRRPYFFQPRFTADLLVLSHNVH